MLSVICGFLGSTIKNFDWIFMFETILSVLQSSTLCWLFSVGLFDSFVPSFSLLLWTLGGWVAQTAYPRIPCPLASGCFHQWRPLAECQMKKNNKFRWWRPYNSAFMWFWKMLHPSRTIAFDQWLNSHGILCWKYSPAVISPWMVQNFLWNNLLPSTTW